jgi:hypothetical protein
MPVEFSSETTQPPGDDPTTETSMIRGWRNGASIWDAAFRAALEIWFHVYETDTENSSEALSAMIAMHSFREASYLNYVESHSVAGEREPPEARVIIAKLKKLTHSLERFKLEVGV